MSVDLSDLFEQKLHSIKYNDKISSSSSSTLTSTSTNTSADPLASLLASLSSKSSSSKNSKQFKDMSSRAKSLIETIASMKRFLIKRRRDYIDMFSSLSNRASTMSDMERDQIDQDMVESMKVCQSKIESLKAEMQKKGTKLSVQRRDIMTAIIESIETYLKVVCDLFSDLRAFRIRRITDKQKLARLDRDLFNKEPCPNEFIYSRGVNDNYDDDDDFNNLIRDDPLAPLKRNLTSTFDGDLHDYPTSPQLSDFSAEELQLFEEENSRLFADINLLETETKSIEGNVYEIAQLHKTFQQNFLQQDEEIQRVHGTAVETSSNIRVGNEELRSAIKNKGQLRIWILFFNIVLSFTLFFLDWYNP